MKIDWFTFGAQIVNFLVLLYLLRRFLYGPITEMMQEREDRIAEQALQAERLQQKAIQAADDFRAKSESLEIERHAMLEQTKAEADHVRKMFLEEARNDIEQRRIDWLRSLEREKDALLRLVRQRCSQQAIQASRRLIDELADSELDEQMYRTFLARLEVENTHPNARSANTAIVKTAHDVPAIWRERLGDAMTHQFNVTEVQFDTADELVFGIEVHLGERKIGWSARDFLSSLDDGLNDVLEKAAK